MQDSIFLSKRFYITGIVCAGIAAATLLSGCGKNIKNSDAVLNKSVNIALNKGNWEEALSYAKLATKTDPNNLDAQIMYSIALENTGDKEAAIKNLKKIVATQPKNFLAQLSLGKILYSKKDYEGAYDHLANAYNLKPNDINTLILYAQCSAKLHAQNTEKLFFKISKTAQFKNKPELYNNMGVYYAETKNYSESIKYLIKAYKISPDNPFIIANLGIFCDKYLKQPKKAKYFYRKFISLSLDNSIYDAKRKEFSNRLKELAKST